MKRKFLAISLATIILSVFSVSFCFASGNMVNHVRNAVGDAENTVEKAGNSISGTIKDGVNTISNGAKNTGSAISNTMDNVKEDTNNTIVGAVTGDSNNGGYTATRTSTDTTDNMGTSTTMFTWVIIGITAVGIGVLLWSYFAQDNKNNMYIDSDEQ